MLRTCRVLDVYSGKTAKLNDTALQTASNTSAYLRYSKADYNLTNLGGETLVLPAPAADWSNFSLINLGGNATFPVITTAMIISASDLSQLGVPPCSAAHICCQALQFCPIPGVWVLPCVVCMALLACSRAYLPVYLHWSVAYICGVR